MSLELSLDGDGQAGGGWQMRGFLGGSWRWFTGPDKPWDGPGWWPGRVPGSVVDDLWRAGQIPSPYFERNTLSLEWVAARDWVYRRRLGTPPLAAGQSATLCFEGVDHRATVLIDGEAVAEHEGMFLPFEVDVTEALRPGGRHLLAVVIHAAPDNEPQMGNTARVRVDKSRMTYGWDFCPRLIHTGIWRSISLHLGARPFRPAVSVELLSGPNGGEGRVSVPGAETLSLRNGDDLVAKSVGPMLSVDRPQLWWPNGLGHPHCYTISAGHGDQRREWQIGFRRLEMVPNPQAPATARPYTVVVNGTGLFLRGWNWAPIDALYGVPRAAKLLHLLSLAAGAGVNCLRVWGGGLMETNEFYGLCDRLGLLVWQEFPLSSSGEGSVPSSDPAYLELMAAEAPVVIGERRHHPSLALWCGGNELAQRLPGRDDLPLDETAPVIRSLAEAVQQHDPGRPFLPTSPSGPHFLNRLDIIAADPDGQHDVHGPWEHQGLSDHNVLYDAGTCLLHSELGVEGMTNRRSLELIIAPAHRWPADRTSDIYEHLGAWWNNAPLVQRCFGGRLSRLDLLRRASQQLQYDGLRYAVESRLRRAPRTSGVFPWQFNEPYPNAWCTAAVDYFGHPKPAYYGVRRAYRPQHVCASFPTWAWANRAEVSAEIFAWPTPATVVARFVDLSGRAIAHEQFEVGPQSSGRAAALTAGAERLGSPIFLLDLVARTSGSITVENRYLLSASEDFAPLLDLPPAQVEMAVDDTGAVTLRHTGGPAALGLVLEDGAPAGQPGWVVFGDNVIDLLPGEVRVVPVERPGADPARPIRVEGWNVAARNLFGEKENV